MSMLCQKVYHNAKNDVIKYVILNVKRYKRHQKVYHAVKQLIMKLEVWKIRHDFKKWTYHDVKTYEKYSIA